LNNVLPLERIDLNVGHIRISRPYAFVHTIMRIRTAAACGLIAAAMGERKRITAASERTKLRREFRDSLPPAEASRTPSATRRDDGAAFVLERDQQNSLRAGRPRRIAVPR
jgi:hypothetical protein